MDSNQRNAILVFFGVLGVGLVGFLAFGYFGIQAAFFDEEVDEAGPAFDSGAAADEEQEAAMEEAAAAEPTEVDESAEDAMEGEVVTLASGQFTGQSSYEVSGDALVLNDGTEQRFLRLESFESSNGPDLNVYLRAEDGEFVDLGDLKGNIGDQNYEIPTEVDLDRFNTVEIWCVRFSVLFGDAALA